MPCVKSREVSFCALQLSIGVPKFIDDSSLTSSGAKLPIAGISPLGAVAGIIKRRRIHTFEVYTFLPYIRGL